LGNSVRSFFRNNVINVAVAIAGLMVFGVGVALALQTYAAYGTTAKMREANGVVDNLLRAAAYEARERGLTSAALGGEPAPETLEDLARLRAEGDAALEAALASLDGLSPGGARVDAHVNRVRAGWQALRDTRERIDAGFRAGIPRVTGSEWLAVTTDLIAAGAALRDEILMLVDAPVGIARMNLTVKRSSWLISEHAGQIRGIVAFYAGAGAPISSGHVEQVRFNRLVIARTLDELLSMRGLPGTPPRLSSAMDVMEVAMADSFERDLDAMLAEADTGLFPMSALEWYETVTAAVDTVIGMSEVASEVTVSHLDRLARRHANTLAGFIAFALVAGLLAALSLARVKKNATALFLQKELAETTLHSIGDAVITTDREGRVEYLNPVAEELTGWTTVEAKGRPSAEVLRLENHLHPSVMDPVGTCLSEGQVVGLTSGHSLLRRDGSLLRIEDSAAPIRGQDGEIVGCVVVFYSTDDSRQTDHLLSYHATRDALTGLINRREFDRRLQDTLDNARLSGRHHVLAYIDLDQFKVLNDTCGHSAGDRMLRQITFLLRKRVRETDTLARLGGDEFALLLNSCSIARAIEVLDELRQGLRGFRFTWEGKTFEITMSIGVVPITALSGGTAELLSEADSACYAAKAKGRNRIQVYHPDDQELSRRQGEMNWVTEITDALREDRMELYCQRLLALRPGQSDGAEVLVRLRARDGTLTPPMAFIPAAERYNLMTDIDRWVIRNTCAALASSGDREAETVFNINLSGLSLSDDDLAGFICDQAQEFGIPPHRLRFEITETSAVASIDTALELIAALNEKGFTFALDDFGSGLSSLAYLKTLPVQHLKVDGTFVRNMLADAVDRTMVQSVVHIAAVLGITVSAEFVEDAGTLDALREMGFDYAQGFAIGRPVPLQDFL
jgi:diguanylate cyclase (GGDEF)-like protein/PAS domain S-box-containing protein